MDQPTVSEQAGVRYLHFDSPWIQGAMQLKRPDSLVLSYTEQMMAWLLFLQPLPEQMIGQLGLGAGSITRFCYRHLPNPLVVVERNPGVIRICEQYFRLPRHTRLRVFREDAESWVKNPINFQTLSVLMVTQTAPTSVVCPAYRTEHWASVGACASAVLPANRLLIRRRAARAV